MSQPSVYDNYRFSLVNTIFSNYTVSIFRLRVLKKVEVNEKELTLIINGNVIRFLPFFVLRRRYFNYIEFAFRRVDSDEN